jgi:hypothetical protein
MERSTLSSRATPSASTGYSGAGPGYLSVWFGISAIPGFLGIFFKSGAFSYNGLFVWWIPSIAFFGWVVIMSGLTLRAIAGQPEPGHEPSQIKDPAVAAELARLRAELAPPRAPST